MKHSNPIQVGVVGLGRAGWKHVKILLGMASQFQLKAVCDPETERCREAVEISGCRSYQDYREFLEDADVELIVLATPTFLHKTQTIEALEIGKNVLCEKPMALSLEDAEYLAEMAAAQECILTAFHNNHFAADFQQILHVMDSGVLGDLIKIQIRWNTFNRRWDWQTLREYGGGMLNNTGAHALEQVLSFLPEDPEQIFCDMRQILCPGNTEDHVKILLHRKGYPVVDMEMSFVDASPSHKWAILGSRGALWGNAHELNWKYFSQDNEFSTTVDVAPPSGRVYHSQKFPWREENWVLSEKAPSSQELFYSNLYDACRHGIPLEVNIERVLRVTALMEGCRKAAENPNPHTVPTPWSMLSQTHHV